MIEKVMIQFGVHFNRKGGGGGHQRGTGDAEDAKSQSQKVAKSHKAKKPPAAAELAMQRIKAHEPNKNRKDKQRGAANAEDAK